MTMTFYILYSIPIIILIKNYLLLLYSGHSQVVILDFREHVWHNDGDNESDFVIDYQIN